MLGALAFWNIGFPEMVVIFVLGLLIYGRRLPEVGAQVGRWMAQLRRSVHEFKSQIDADEDFRKVRSSMRDVRSDLRELDPRRIAMDSVAHVGATHSGGQQRSEHDDLTDESLSSPAPHDLAAAPRQLRNGVESDPSASTGPS